VTTKNAKDATIDVHQGDIPLGVEFCDAIAVDTEAMGLNNHRDRLCVVQLSSGDGTAHLVKFDADDDYSAPNLKALLADNSKTKIFHYARFDVAIIRQYLDVVCQPIYCTKIASYLARTYTNGHGLKDLCRELLGIELSKTQQSSDWGVMINLATSKLSMRPLTFYTCIKSAPFLMKCSSVKAAWSILRLA
jgi:ribonuclease D